jgi:exosortase A-associated hydrolase 1
MPALRFDYRGMGDSDGDTRSFDAVDADIAAAIDALVRETGAMRVVLWGLCDGASAAMIYAARDPRVVGVIAVNPWAHTAQVEASTRLRHYYVRRVLSREFWQKLFAGGVDVRRSGDDLIGAVRTAATAQASGASDAYLPRMHEGWARLRRPILLMLSGSDLTAREFEAWVAADARRGELARRPGCAITAIRDADHTFSSRASRDAMTRCTLDWLRALR